MHTTPKQLKQRLASRELLVGTFVTTPYHSIFEVLGFADFDFVIMDTEHTPFSHMAMDTCIMAARAAGLPVIVRLPSAAQAEIQNALDIGATGVHIPHILSPHDAEAALRATRYGVPGGRGFAASVRAAAYTTKPLQQHLQNAAAQTILLATIEDPEAVEQVEAIAAVPGLDALFIGPMDLTVAYGEQSPESPRVQQAIARIGAAGMAAGIGVGLFIADESQVPQYQAMGVTYFLIATDHLMMLESAARQVQGFRTRIKK